MYSSTAKYAADLLPSFAEFIVDCSLADCRNQQPRRSSFGADERYCRLSNQRHALTPCVTVRKNEVKSRPIADRINKLR